MKNGLVHIYTGDGKGKTTASVGLAVRCRGYGKKVRIFQFLKSMRSGELTSLEKLGIDVIKVSANDKFYYNMTESERKNTSDCIKETIKHIYDKKCDLLILDEIICVFDLSIIDREELLSIIKSKPETCELVLTGRNMPEFFTEFADYVSEIRCIKHPYEKGVDARESIEY